MLIAISTTGKRLESQVTRFDRCAYFLLVQIKDKKIEKIDKIENLFRARIGAEPEIVKLIIDKEVNVVFTEAVSPPGFRALVFSGIDVYIVAGKAKDILNKFLAGQLKKKEFFPKPAEFNKWRF